MKAKYIANYVNIDVLNRLGFNEYEPSINFTKGTREKMKFCTAHIGYYSEKESVLISMKNLRTFPWIEERVTTGDTCLHGWYFNQGKLSVYNERKETFELIDFPKK